MGFHLVDTHCHLDVAEFDPDRAQVMERARAAGVECVLIDRKGDAPLYRYLLDGELGVFALNAVLPDADAFATVTLVSWDEDLGPEADDTVVDTLHDLWGSDAAEGENVDYNSQDKTENPRTRRKTAKDFVKAATSKEMEYLDIPAFLRRQAD